MNDPFVSYKKNEITWYIIHPSHLDSYYLHEGVVWRQAAELILKKESDGEWYIWVDNEAVVLGNAIPEEKMNDVEKKELSFGQLVDLDRMNDL